MQHLRVSDLCKHFLQRRFPRTHASSSVPIPGTTKASPLPPADYNNWQRQTSLPPLVSPSQMSPTAPKVKPSVPVKSSSVSPCLFSIPLTTDSPNDFASQILVEEIFFSASKFGISYIQDRANGIRGYKNKVRLHGLRKNQGI